ncbi:MAG TPA: cytochrome c oxidase subunit I [Methylomirabilota bacterium]|nr:cytochrome c oxidase subunit I [Methylomirabilota bacterium]
MSVAFPPAARIAPGRGDDREADLLARTWASPPGIRGWFTTVHHRTIGLRYIATALVFFTAGGVEALLMRLQLARPENALLGPQAYNRLFTLHGNTMMFLFAVPIMEGLAIYLVPLMIGTRNVAFPRLNAYGYYAYLIGGLLLYGALPFGGASDVGWFSYVPLATLTYSPGKGVDVWTQMIYFTELSALVVAVELIVTIFKLRAPGMSLDRMPLFVWSMLVMSVMIVFAMPAIIVATTFLPLDRMVETRFFDVAAGADPLLWQHLFWFFGHPEVYIVFVPALGIVSSIVVAFAGRPIVGYTAMVFAVVATGFLGFGLWVHHMFATGLPQLGMSFFTAASMMIAIPSGIQIFCWIATLWAGRPRLRTPLLFVLGFVSLFVVGGLTGVMLASAPLDLQVHDTFFVVGHFHYTLIGGAVFPLFAAFYYWFPKVTGRRLGEGLGRWNFWLLFIGFNATFFPMHLLGLQGMPRRVYTYSAELGWGSLNLVATGGALLLAAGLLLFLVNVAWSVRRGAIAGDNPWEADTLEWATASPPPAYNLRRIPVVTSRYPLWAANGASGNVEGLRIDRREVLVTTPLDAEPDHRALLPGPSAWPLALGAATGVGFIGAILSPVWALIGAGLAFVALVGWFWPRPEPGRDRREAVP